MEINHLGERGIRLSSITGGIELGLADNLNAQFVADSIVGNVISDIANIKLSTDGQSDYEAQIGSGGRRITISSVKGGIRLRKLSRGQVSADVAKGTLTMLTSLPEPMFGSRRVKESRCDQ